MKDLNPFKILPLLIAVQIIAGILLGGSTTVEFPESDASLNVEIADTESERRRGLMFREKLSIDNGMLFVFPDEEYRGFWMKNTLIPLDMIFVDEEGRIVNIEEAVPEPNTSDEDLKTYRSERPVKYVIETNSTFTEKWNVTEGEKVVLP